MESENINFKFRMWWMNLDGKRIESTKILDTLKRDFNGDRGILSFNSEKEKG